MPPLLVFPQVSVVQPTFYFTSALYSHSFQVLISFCPRQPQSFLPFTYQASKHHCLPNIFNNLEAMLELLRGRCSKCNQYSLCLPLFYPLSIQQSTCMCMQAKKQESPSLRFGEQYWEIKFFAFQLSFDWQQFSAKNTVPVLLW